MVSNRIPSATVLVIAGYEPNGFAGTLADENLLVSLGHTAISVITAETDQQHSRQANKINATDYTLVKQQIDAALNQNTISAIKIGQIPNAEVLMAISAAINNTNIPAVWDPVLKTSNGISLSTLTTEEITPLLTAISLVTPNTAEALELSGQTDNRSAALWFIEQGCKQVLITGTDASNSNQIIHELHSEKTVQPIKAKKLAGNFRGSGCRLSTLCAIELSAKKSMLEAITCAQEKLAVGIENASHISNNDYLINHEAIAHYG